MKKQNYKNGAASFYIVAFSTLILMIVAMSFAAVIISEVTRTSNDDLSQSAYDSALAGIEDAKLAYFNYQNCKAQDEHLTPVKPADGATDLTCQNIAWYVEKSDDCDMVAKILGRDVTESGVDIKESNTSDNNMAQMYTCVKMTDTLSDYRSTLSSSNMIKVLRAKFDDGVHASQIKTVKISWYADLDKAFNYKNFDKNSGKVTFPRLSGVSGFTPPVISFTFLQTAPQFTLSDFDSTIGDRTNKGTLYLVPANDKDKAAANVDGNHRGTNYGVGVSGEEVSLINAQALLKSNNKTKENEPYSVYCSADSDSEFACSAEITLPKPVNGERNDDTFVFVIGLPYGAPSTDFSLAFFCDVGQCASANPEGDDPGSATQAKLKGVQVQVDSTGRANDLFRRVETRLEDTNSFALSLMGPLELFGQSSDGGDSALKKDYAVTCEYDFDPTCTR